MKHRLKKNQFWLHLFTFPFIWFPAIPTLLLDLSMEIYHQVCFPIYGLEKVKRSDYIQIWDRAKLEYLTPIDKINCAYCGYANGVFPYLAEICKRTESYWCGIMHDSKYSLKARPHHQGFAEYDNKDSFEQKFPDGNARNNLTNKE